MIMYCGAKTALQYESDIRRNYLESFPVSLPPDSPELLTLVEGEPPSTLLILYYSTLPIGKIYMEIWEQGFQGVFLTAHSPHFQN